MEGRWEHRAPSPKPFQARVTAFAAASISFCRRTLGFCRGLVLLFQFRQMKGAKAMIVTSPLLEVIAVLIPDFQTWGLSASVLFSLHPCAQAFGLPWVGAADSGLMFSLVVGYVFNLGLNLGSFLWCTSPLRVATWPGPESGVEQSVREAPAPHRATIAFPKY